MSVLYLQIEVLPEISKAVGNKIEIYMDGGVTQGIDVFKALALGAKMVFVKQTVFNRFHAICRFRPLIDRFFSGIFW